MTGIITDIFDSDVKTENFTIKKKTAIISDINKPGESIAVEFKGQLRRTLIRDFKAFDRVEVEYNKRANKGNNGKAYNTLTATEITKS